MSLLPSTSPTQSDAVAPRAKRLALRDSSTARSFRVAGLMRERGVTSGQLARWLGVARSFAGRLLTGERRFTDEHIAALPASLRAAIEAA
jgi:hypothetical protein